MRNRFRHAVQHSKLGTLTVLNWHPHRSELAPSPSEESFLRAFASTGGATSQTKARCLPTEALESEALESEALESASERSADACLDAVNTNQKRKRMGIEPTKRLFGRFTSFED